VTPGYNGNETRYPRSRGEIEQVHRRTKAGREAPSIASYQRTRPRENLRRSSKTRDLVVLDDWKDRIPITSAEIVAVETYLNCLLDRMLSEIPRIAEDSSNKSLGG